MADYFNVSTDYLLGRLNAPTPLSEKQNNDEKGSVYTEEALQLALRISQLAPDHRERVLDYVRLVENQPDAASPK